MSMRRLNTNGSHEPAEESPGDANLSGRIPVSLVRNVLMNDLPRRMLTCLLVAGSTLAGACGPSAAGKSATATERDQLVVRRGDFVDTFLLTGQVDASTSANIVVPRIPSWQTSIQWIAEDGIAVQKGDRVAELDNSANASDLEQKQLNAENARQELARVEADAEAAIGEKEFDVASRQSELEKAGVAAKVPKEIQSEREWDERQLALAKAQSELEKAVTLLASARTAAAKDRQNKLLEIRKLEREIEIAQLAVDTMVLRAPESGVFITNDHPWQGRKLRAGDAVWVGFQIARIPDLTTLRIIAGLADVDDRKIEKGMPVAVTLDAYPDVALKGRIASIAPMAKEVDRRSLRRAFDVLVDLVDVESDRMRPGLSARIEVTREVREGVLLAPRAAVDRSRTPATVSSAGGRAIEVKLGPCNAIDCVVLEGVEEGTRLVAAVGKVVPSS